MIVTLTPNPSIDRTVHLGVYVREAINRATGSMVEPSGKGINVALALHRSGCAVTAVFPFGGGTGVELAAMLAQTALPVVGVPVAGAVRVNLSIIEADGTSTKINEPGPDLSAGEVDALIDGTLRECSAGDWLLLGGSLPPGFSTAQLIGLAGSAGDRGVHVALDSSGDALVAGVTHADLIKPNAQELAELTDTSITTLGEALQAARGLLTTRLRTVLVSLGGDGALLIEQDVALHGRAPVDRVVNTVGAGDAFLAGYLSAVDAAPAARLEAALRWGAAAVQQVGTLFPAPDDRVEVTIGPIDPGRPLAEPVSLQEPT